MDLKNEFVPYEQALALKELGFNEPCFGYYDGNRNLQLIYNGIPEKFTEKRMGLANSVWVGWISAPLYQQAFRWFREKYGLTFTIRRHFNCYNITEILEYNNIDDGNVEIELNGLDWEDFNSYEEAELECLKKLIEIIKENK